MALAEEVDPAAIARRAEDAGLRLVRFLWCGNDGTVRAKASSRHGLEGRIRAGIGLTVAMQAMNGLDHLQPVEGMGPVGEIRLVPDPDTFRVLPYAPNTGAMLVDQLALDGAVAPVDQRGFLKRMAARLAERAHGAQVGHPAGDVRPLARVLALGEQAAELVERPRGRDDPVGVVVDEPDRVQYFSKCPCCSNASSSAEYASHSDRRTAR